MFLIKLIISADLNNETVTNGDSNMLTVHHAY